MGDQSLVILTTTRRHLVLVLLAMSNLTGLSGAPDVYLREMPTEAPAPWRLVSVLEAVGRAIRRGFQGIRAIFVDDRVRRRTRSPELERGDLWSGSRRLVAQSIRTYGATLRSSVPPAPVPAPAPPSYGSAETVYVECQTEF